MCLQKQNHPYGVVDHSRHGVNKIKTRFPSSEFGCRSLKDMIYPSFCHVMSKIESEKITVFYQFDYYFKIIKMFKKNYLIQVKFVTKFALQTNFSPLLLTFFNEV